MLLERERGLGPSDGVVRIRVIPRGAWPRLEDLGGAGPLGAGRTVRAVAAKGRPPAGGADDLLDQLESGILIELFRDRLLQLDRAHRQDAVGDDLLGRHPRLHRGEELVADLDRHRSPYLGRTFRRRTIRSPARTPMML